MEADSHYSIRCVEGLLNPVAMMNINVNVEDSIVVLEEFEDRNHDVIDEAEPTCLLFLGMVEPPGPVDTHIRHSVVEHDCGIDAAPCRDLGQIKHPREGWTVIVVAISNVELVLFIEHGSRVARRLARVNIWYNTLEMLDVIFAVEGAHFVY